jgi:hypothetical protein
MLLIGVPPARIGHLGVRVRRSGGDVFPDCCVSSVGGARLLAVLKAMF